MVLAFETKLYCLPNVYSNSEPLCVRYAPRVSGRKLYNEFVVVVGGSGDDVGGGDKQTKRAKREHKEAQRQTGTFKRKREREKQNGGKRDVNGMSNTRCVCRARAQNKTGRNKYEE